MAENPQQFIPTRASLLIRLKNLDDQESWNDFFNTYWKLIYGVAIKSGLTEPEAQEVVQETLISVAKSIQGFKYDPEVCSFKSWLRLLVRRRIADQFRKRPREALIASVAHSQSDTGTSEIDRIADPAGSQSDAVWAEEWEKILIDVALERLKRQVSAEHYQIFYLHVIKQLSAREVARALGVNVGQVYLTKHRLSKSFRKSVQELSLKLV